MTQNEVPGASTHLGHTYVDERQDSLCRIEDALDALGNANNATLCDEIRVTLYTLIRAPAEDRHDLTDRLMGLSIKLGPGFFALVQQSTRGLFTGHEQSGRVTLG